VTSLPDEPSVWAELRAQRDLLIEMKTRFEQVQDHELRLRRLEERKFPLPTVAVLVALCSLIASVIVYVVK
jgi:hypothetical protein